MIKIDKLVRSKRKTVSFQISKEGELIVRAPEKVNKAFLDDMLAKHKHWIEDKQANAKRKLAPIKQFREGDLLYYLGKGYPLRYVEDYEFAFNFTDSEFILDATLKEDAKDIFIKWYKIQAKNILLKKTAEISQSIGLKYNVVKISSAVKRWGSCNTKGNINLSYRLVMLPPEIINYVIIHELCHLVHFSHSKAFWNLVEKYFPNHKLVLKWMDDNVDRMVI